MEWIRWEGERLTPSIKRGDRVIVKLKNGEVFIISAYSSSMWGTPVDSEDGIASYIPLDDVIAFLDRISEGS